MKFKRKVNTVDAIQWTGDNVQEIKELLRDFPVKKSNENLKIKVNGNNFYVFKENYIILEGQNVMILSKEDFNKTFEEVTKQIKKTVKVGGPKNPRDN